ncbi:MAG TPA: hypothetical protein VLG50_06480 [Candidatus Saccharimonadales bacterium]|nr:hypothetical protein [Candidatus Saccharimonadales bacterium]
MILQPITSLNNLLTHQNSCFYNIKNGDDSNSTDSEQNSHGSCSSDIGFDIVSRSTESSDVEQNLCDFNKNHIIDSIQDVCDYSCDQIYLLTDGSIKIASRLIKNNRFINTLISFNGYLYACDKFGTLYYLSNRYDEGDYWVWKTATWAPSDIQHLSVTLNGQFLFLSTNKKSYLFDQCMKKYRKFTTGELKRVYGKDDTCYLEFDAEKRCHITINNMKVKTIGDCISGIMDYYYNIHLLTTKDYIYYKDVKWLNYKPYYIKR